MGPPKTEEEKQVLIQKFREKSSKYVLDAYWNMDTYILKWLELKNYHVERAEKAFRRALEWRMDNNIDSVLTEDFSDFERNLIYYIDGVDNEGKPVVTIPCNECYLRSEIDVGNDDRIKKFVFFILETAADKIKQRVMEDDSAPSTFVAIIDAQDVEVADISPKMISFMVTISRICEDYYPGLLEAAFVINASKTYKRLFNTVKPLLRNKTAELVKVYGEKREKWEPKVLKNISPDQLRFRFGGTRPDEIIESKEGDLTKSLAETMKKVKEIAQDPEKMKQIEDKMDEAKASMKASKKKK